MRQRILSLLGWSSEEDLVSGGPFYLLLLAIMVAVYVMVLVNDPAMRQAAPLILFTALMVAHAALRLWGFRIVQQQPRRRLVVYFLVQGGLALSIGMLAQLEGLILALYMALVGEAAGMLWPDWRALAAAASFFVVLMAVNVVLIWGAPFLLGLLPVLGLVLAFVLVYVLLYIRQVQAREEAQTLLHELEAAHRRLEAYAAQVEALSISQERQRMARELHDTLAQGLAGLILQLEAADGYLETGNQAQARTVVQQAMQRARSTLHEARRAIQALRPAVLEQGNLVDALDHEVDQFAATSRIRVTLEVSGDPPAAPVEITLDILRIVQEALSNARRHAQAGQVVVQLANRDRVLQVVVQDDGVGFDPGEALDRPDRFGLAGMQERAERIGATLQVESGPGQGTRVVLRVGGLEGGVA
jgi:NarL family two-component system sensor histidine kinase YdfH